MPAVEIDTEGVHLTNDIEAVTEDGTNDTEAVSLEINPATPDYFVTGDIMIMYDLEMHNLQMVSLDTLLLHFGGNNPMSFNRFGLTHAIGIDVNVGLSAPQHAHNLHTYGENTTTPPRSTSLFRFCPCSQPPLDPMDRLLPPEVRVKRCWNNNDAGIITQYNVNEFQNVFRSSLVPGDIVLLCLGDKIPADMRIVKILEEPLRVLNTVLTGEPDALTRDALVSSERDPLNASNLVFAGMLCASGRAECVVLKTGDNTVMASLIGLLQ